MLVPFCVFSYENRFPGYHRNGLKLVERKAGYQEILEQLDKLEEVKWMGMYLNPGNGSFAKVVTNDIYVDKTGLIKYLNGRIDKEKHLIASSRPRRFGKTMAVRMLTAYYSKNCDSKALFCNLEISQDASFEEHLNQYDVIRLDIQWMRGIALERIREKKAKSVIGFIQTEVVKELLEAYPEYVAKDETLIAAALADINKHTQTQFVLIIDEWDCVFREDKNDKKLQLDYIAFLRSLFKGNAADEFVKLAYITGILPIKKYGTQSALNNFRELTMTEPAGITEYIGFTEDEVRNLYKKYNMPFRKMQEWYDGYLFHIEELSSDDDGEYDSLENPCGKSGKDAAIHVYNPNSVMEAISNRRFQNYWSQTETYEDLKIYIEMDFDGLKQKIVEMLGGERCKVVTRSFQNDMTSFKSASDVLTLLVHLGYLAYDNETDEAFIPNEEIRDTFVLSIMDGSWGEGIR